MDGKTNNNFIDSFNAFTISSTLIVSGFIIIVSKKMLDLAFSSILMRYTQSIKSEVENQLNPLKKDLADLKKDLSDHRASVHARSTAAESTLNYSIDILQKYANELHQKKSTKKNGK